MIALALRIFAVAWIAVVLIPVGMVVAAMFVALAAGAFP
jgi:hypothetical protein